MEPITDDSDDDRQKQNELAVRLDSLDKDLKDIRGSMKTESENTERRLIKLEEFMSKFKVLTTESGDIEGKLLEITETIRRANDHTTEIDRLGGELTGLSDDLRNVAKIDEKVPTIEGSISSIKTEIKSLKDEGVKLGKKWKMADKKIQELKIDSLTEQFNSFLERNDKFDHEGDEKFWTFFQGFTVDTAILSSCTLARSSHDLAQFEPLLLTLTIATSVFFLALSAKLCISIWDLLSPAKNLTIERDALESAFEIEEERKADIEGEERDPDAVARAKMKKECLQNIQIKFKPLALVGVFILVGTIAFFVTQIILLVKMSQTKPSS